jgi:hypothetical protein
MYDMSNHSKEIDALVLTGYTSIVTELPYEEHVKAVTSSVYHLRNHTSQHQAEELTEEDKSNIWAAEAFLTLGHIASRRLLDNGDYPPLSGNPYLALTVRAVDEISPFKRGDRFAFALPRNFPPRTVSSEAFKNAVEGMLTLAPAAQTEFQEKWGHAQAMNKARGHVTLEAYYGEELLADRPASQIPTHTADFPYYATFGPQNGAEMLQSALEDLQNLSDILKIV